MSTERSTCGRAGEVATSNWNTSLWLGDIRCLNTDQNELKTGLPKSIVLTDCRDSFELCWYDATSDYFASGYGLGVYNDKNFFCPELQGRSVSTIITGILRELLGEVSEVYDEVSSRDLRYSVISFLEMHPNVKKSEVRRVNKHPICTLSSPEMISSYVINLSPETNSSHETISSRIIVVCLDDQLTVTLSTGDCFKWPRLR